MVEPPSASREAEPFVHDGGKPAVAVGQNAETPEWVDALERALRIGRDRAAADAMVGVAPNDEVAIEPANGAAC